MVARNSVLLCTGCAYYRTNVWFYDLHCMSGEKALPSSSATLVSCTGVLRVDLMRGHFQLQNTAELR